MELCQKGLPYTGDIVINLYCQLYKIMPWWPSCLDRGALLMLKHQDAVCRWFKARQGTSS